MNTIKIADLKNNLSRHLTRVRRGGEVTILDRDTPIARIVPFAYGETAARTLASKAQRVAADRIADLARQGIVSPGDGGAVADWLERRQPIKRPKGAPTATDLLLDMRRGSPR